MSKEKKEPNTWTTLGCGAGLAFGATYGYLDAASKLQETGTLSKTVFAMVTGIAVKHTIDAHKQYTNQQKPEFHFNDYMQSFAFTAFGAAMFLHIMTMGDLGGVAKIQPEATSSAFLSAPSPTLKTP